MNFNDIDQFYVKAISALHSRDHLRPGEPTPLQKIVEDAIKSKSGKDKDLTSYVAPCVKPPIPDDPRTTGGPIEGARTPSSSDNELELDLWNEDLMCVVCKAMDVGARNRLLECSECQILYHQECHRPPVSQQDADQVWTCQSCKDAKKTHKSPISSRPGSPHAKSSSKSSSSSSSHRTSSGSYKSSSSSSKSSSQNKSGSSGSSKASKQSSSSAGSSPAHGGNSSKPKPTINIISADKRLQSMKKKAAKLQEKRKLTR